MNRFPKRLGLLAIAVLSPVALADEPVPITPLTPAEYMTFDHVMTALKSGRKVEGYVNASQCSTISLEGSFGDHGDIVLPYISINFNHAIQINAELTAHHSIPVSLAQGTGWKTFGSVKQILVTNKIQEGGGELLHKAQMASSTGSILWSHEVSCKLGVGAHLWSPL